MKNSPDKHAYTLMEKGTDKYPDLRMAQAVALPVVAQAIVAAIREGAYSGLFKLHIEEDENEERDPSIEPS